MSKFQHDVMLRIVKILNVLMIELPFAACWFLYYSHQTYANLAWEGHFAILGLFFILYIVLGKIYDAFWMSMQRVSELVYGQILGAMATDGILYIVICLMSAKLCNLLPGIAAIAGQLVMAAIWASCAHKWYYKTFPPQKTAVVYDVRHGMEKLINEYALGADTYVINNKPNGLNINNNAGSTHIEGLQKFVVENGLDVGFAFDGDADRCLCVDEKGNVVTGDHILYIYGCYMQEHGELTNNTVVTTVMSNFGLYKAFDEQGIGYAKTAVGDKYVYEYMAKNGCRIGGEQSGHIIFSKYASTGDGILTSLKMMEVMLAKKLPMSKLAEPLKIYPQVLENVRVTDKKAAQNDPAVQEAVKAVAEALGDTGRILVRESGTEPLVRVMVEAPDHDTCQKYVSQVVDTIKINGYGV